MIIPAAVIKSYYYKVTFSFYWTSAHVSNWDILHTDTVIYFRFSYEACVFVYAMSVTLYKAWLCHIIIIIMYFDLCEIQTWYSLFVPTCSSHIHELLRDKKLAFHPISGICKQRDVIVITINYNYYYYYIMLLNYCVEAPSMNTIV